MLRNLVYRAGLIGLSIGAVVLAVRAGTIPADALPLPNRLATADTVVVGKITAIEDKTEMVAPFPGARNKIEYKIAVVKISEAIRGQKGMATLRLGFVPTPMGVVINPPPFQPVVGMEGVFFLTKHD